MAKTEAVEATCPRCQSIFPQKRVFQMPCPSCYVSQEKNRESRTLLEALESIVALLAEINERLKKRAVYINI